jgi:hypothetical protein
MYHIIKSFISDRFTANLVSFISTSRFHVFPDRIEVVPVDIRIPFSSIIGMERLDKGIKYHLIDFFFGSCDRAGPGSYSGYFLEEKAYLYHYSLRRRNRHPY